MPVDIEYRLDGGSLRKDDRYGSFRSGKDARHFLIVLESFGFYEFCRVESQSLFIRIIGGGPFQLGEPSLFFGSDLFPFRLLPLLLSCGFGQLFLDPVGWGDLSDDDLLDLYRNPLFLHEILHDLLDLPFDGIDQVRFHPGSRACGILTGRQDRHRIFRDLITELFAEFLLDIVLVPVLSEVLDDDRRFPAEDLYFDVGREIDRDIVRCDDVIEVLRVLLRNHIDDDIIRAGPDPLRPGGQWHFPDSPVSEEIGLVDDDHFLSFGDLHPLEGDKRRSQEADREDSSRDHGISVRSDPGKADASLLSWRHLFSLSIVHGVWLMDE